MAKKINRKGSLNHVVTDADGLGVVFADAAGGPRKLRCPNCREFAAPLSNDGKGTKYACPGCRREFTSSSF